MTEPYERAHPCYLCISHDWYEEEDEPTVPYCDKFDILPVARCSEYHEVLERGKIILQKNSEMYHMSLDCERLRKMSGLPWGVVPEDKKSDFSPCALCAMGMK
jgi:hypothetical protein